MQEDASNPASILHVDGHIQAEHVLERFTVHLRGLQNSVLPNIASMASPGMKRTERNTRTLKMSRVGTISSKRRMM